MASKKNKTKTDRKVVTKIPKTGKLNVSDVKKAAQRIKDNENDPLYIKIKKALTPEANKVLNGLKNKERSVSKARMQLLTDLTQEGEWNAEKYNRKTPIMNENPINKTVKCPGGTTSKHYVKFPDVAEFTLKDCNLDEWKAEQQRLADLKNSIKAKYPNLPDFVINDSNLDENDMPRLLSLDELRRLKLKNEIEAKKISEPKIQPNTQNMVDFLKLFPKETKLEKVERLTFEAYQEHIKAKRRYDILQSVLDSVQNEFYDLNSLLISSIKNNIMPDIEKEIESELMQYLGGTEVDIKNELEEAFEGRKF